MPGLSSLLSTCCVQSRRASNKGSEGTQICDVYTLPRITCALKRLPPAPPPPAALLNHFWARLPAAQPRSPLKAAQPHATCRNIWVRARLAATPIPKKELGTPERNMKPPEQPRCPLVHPQLPLYLGQLQQGSGSSAAG